MLRTNDAERFFVDYFKKNLKKALDKSRKMRYNIVTSARGFFFCAYSPRNA